VSGEERTPEEWEDEFEAIVDSPDQDPMKFHIEVSPIDPDEDLADVPKYRTLQEAVEAWKKAREEREQHD
jgi:hypothetical protein